MINYSWITTQPIIPSVFSAHIICLPQHSSICVCLFSSFWCSLNTHIHTHMQNEESSVRCTGLGLPPGGCSTSPPSPPWRCSGLVGRCYALALPWLFNSLQSIFPHPDSVCNCLPLSLIIYLPLYLASLTETHPSLCLSSTGGCLLPKTANRGEKKGGTWAGWCSTVFTQIH